MAIDLTPAKAFIFRITHRNNLKWILEHGLHCSSSEVRDPHFEAIGNAELIGKRTSRALPPPHGGTLSDYVPFYFTPASPMALNIKTGQGGVRRRRNEEIVALVSSLGKLQREGVPFVFTDRHAYLVTAQFSGDLADLSHLPWQHLRERDFRRDPNDPEKMERYQAEALAWQHVPASALLGVACVNELVAADLNATVENAGAPLRVYTRPNWYF